MTARLADLAWRALALAGRVLLVVQAVRLALDWYLHPPQPRRWP
jgi:hypothetical protein